MQPLVQPGSQTEQVGRLLVAVMVVMTLPALPFGGFLAYPFVFLTTWFHEMGHGLAAMLVGQDFEQLMIFHDGSGVAQSVVDADISPLASAAIAAGGPIAPCIAGSLLIMASAHERMWRPVLWGLAAVIFASVIVYVRSAVGAFVLPVVGAAIALVAWRASAAITRFTLQFLGLLGALSMLRDFDYLFTYQVVINGRMMLSDTGQMQAALWLPYWVWAAVILAVCGAMVFASLRYALQSGRRPPQPPAPKPPANVLQFQRTKR